MQASAHLCGERDRERGRMNRGNEPFPSFCTTRITKPPCLDHGHGCHAQSQHPSRSSLTFNVVAVEACSLFAVGEGNLASHWRPGNEKPRPQTVLCDSVCWIRGCNWNCSLTETTDCQGASQGAETEGGGSLRKLLGPRASRVCFSASRPPSPETSSPPCLSVPLSSSLCLSASLRASFGAASSSYSLFAPRQALPPARKPLQPWLPRGTRVRQALPPKLIGRTADCALFADIQHKTPLARRCGGG